MRLNGAQSLDVPKDTRLQVACLSLQNMGGLVDMILGPDIERLYMAILVRNLHGNVTISKIGDRVRFGLFARCHRAS